MIKVIGTIIILLISLIMGLILNYKTKYAIKLCNNLIDFCDGLIVDLTYKATPILVLVEKLNKNNKYLNFIDCNVLTNKQNVSTCFDKQDDERLNEFLFSIGKSDVESQLKIIKSYKNYLVLSKNKYEQKNISKSKINIAMPLCFGIMFSVVIF